MVMHLVLALSTPFEISVDFNDDELCTANTDATTCEWTAGSAANLVGGGGILGFSMCYQQIDT